MGFPICDSCAAEGSLCKRCLENVRSEKISELDVLVSSILARHGAGGYIALEDLETKLLILADEEDAPRIIGTKGNCASELSKKTGRRVIVLVKGWGTEKIIDSIAKPSKLIERRKLFKHDGTEYVKLIFDKPLDEGTVRLLKKIIGDFEVEYKAGGQKRE